MWIWRQKFFQNTAENYWNGTDVLSTLRKLGVFAYKVFSDEQKALVF